MARERSMKVNFLADASKLNRGLKDALNGLDDIEDAGDRAAAAIRIFTDQTESNLREAANATDALKQALGAETVAAIEQAGGSVDRWVSDLRKLGLTYEDVANSADKLATEIRRAEDINARTIAPLATSADTAATSVRRLASDGDQTRSVLANMVGNSVQDLGQLGGIAGSAGVMIGQLGEYAADGNIKLANLVRLVGPMAALGLATAGVTAYMEAQAREAAELARITQFLGDVQKQIAEGDFTGAGAQLAGEYQDTIKVLEQYGMGVEDLINTLDGEDYAIRNVERAIRDLQDARQSIIDTGELPNGDVAGVNDVAAIESQIEALKDLNDTLGEDQRAAEDAARANEILGRTSAEAANVFERWSKQATVWATDMADADKAATSHENKLRSLRQQVEDYIATTKNIPDEEITDIRAALDSGNITLIERLLANLTRNRIVNIGVALSGLDSGRQVGKGPSGTAGSKSSTPSVAYNAGALLGGLVADINATAGGGGGGGGGGAAAEEDPMVAFDRAYGNLYDTGQASLDAFRTYLQGRLSAYASYSNEYKTIWDRIQGLNRDEKAAQDALAAAEKERQEAAKKAADEAKKAAEETKKLAEQQLATMRQLLEALTGFATATYGNLAGTGGNVTGPGADDLQAIGGAIAALLRGWEEGNS